MHDCDVTREMLADLLFDELEEGPRLSLLEDVRICGGCSEQYRAMAETLRVMDVGMDACLPAEEFWPGYEERLSERMAAEIQLSFWQQAAPRGEYSLTILEDSGVARRLLKELRAAASESQLTWPEFKRDPFGFAGRSVSAYSQVAWRFFSERNVALATALVLRARLLHRRRRLRARTTAAGERGARGERGERRLRVRRVGQQHEHPARAGAARGGHARA